MTFKDENAPAEYPRRMESIFEGFYFIQIYIIKISTVSENLEEHDSHLTMVCYFTRRGPKLLAE